MGLQNALGSAVPTGEAALAGDMSAAMGLALVAVVGLVIAALTAKTRAIARGGTSNRRLRKAEATARREFTQAADEAIQRHLAELPPEPKPARFAMDIRPRIDLGDEMAAGDLDVSPADVAEADADVQAVAAESEVDG